MHNMQQQVNADVNPELTAFQLTILNQLKSLNKLERITHKQLSAITGYSMRECMAAVEQLRRLGYWIVSSKRKEDLGTRLAIDEAEWHDYLARRQKEILNTLNSIS